MHELATVWGWWSPDRPAVARWCRWVQPRPHRAASCPLLHTGQGLVWISPRRADKGWRGCSLDGEAAMLEPRMALLAPPATATWGEKWMLEKDQISSLPRRGHHKNNKIKHKSPENPSLLKRERFWVLLRHISGKEIEKAGKNAIFSSHALIVFICYSYPARVIWNKNST